MAVDAPINLPYIGQHVLYSASTGEKVSGNGKFAAIVTKVVSAGVVNLTVFVDGTSAPLCKASVPYIPSPDHARIGQVSCCAIEKPIG